jgi:hypothetical protein
MEEGSCSQGRHMGNKPALTCQCTNVGLMPGSLTAIKRGGAGITAMMVESLCVRCHSGRVMMEL